MEAIKKTAGLSAINAGLLFKIAETETEKDEIYQSRYLIANDLFPFLFTSTNNGHVAKDIFDNDSFLFYCKEKTVIGSCRVTPFVNNKWEITDSLPGGIDIDVDTSTTVQLNRVYVGENYRTRAIHEFMFYHFSLWIMKETKYTEYFAVCNAGLVRLYQSLGAKLKLADGFHLSGRLGHEYYLIAGSIHEFNLIIKNKYSL